MRRTRLRERRPHGRLLRACLCVICFWLGWLVWHGGLWGAPRRTRRRAAGVGVEHAIEERVVSACAGGNTSGPCVAPEFSAAEWREWGALVAASGCNPFDVPFDPVDDARCLETIGTASTWTELRPVPQTDDARTIKLEARWGADPRLRLLIKLPQRGFTLEPYNEVAAFAADRVLAGGRVPPTALAFLPIARLRDVAAAHDPESGALLRPMYTDIEGIESFREYVEEVVIAHAADAGLLPYCPGCEVLPVSVQLFVHDVRKLTDSVYAHPLTFPSDGGKRASWRRHLAAADREFPAAHHVALLWESYAAVFDYVMGNRDRAPDKNNFVVGGCVGGGCAGSPGPRHPGRPTFVLLDNGKILSELDVKSRRPNPFHIMLTAPDAEGEFCVFDRGLVEAVAAVPPEAFPDRLRAVLPAAAAQVIPDVLLEACGARLETVRAQVEKCVSRYGRRSVLRS